MKIMKNLLALLMAGLILAGTLTACSEDGGAGEKTGTTGSAQAGQSADFAKYEGLTPNAVYNALYTADQLKITVTERGLEGEGEDASEYAYSTLIERSGDSVALTSTVDEEVSVEYVDFDAGRSYYENSEGQWVYEDAYYADWADLLTMFSEGGYEILFANGNFTADGDRFTITSDASTAFFDRYGGELAEQFGEQDVKLSGGMTREGTRYSFSLELLRADDRMLMGSDITVEFCATSVTLPEASPLEPDSTDEDDQPDLPEDTLLTSELYASLDFSKYLEIPDLSIFKGKWSAVEAEWESFADYVRHEYMTFTDAPEGAEAEINGEVNVHYKGYAAYPEEDLLSEGTLANMTNIAYDEEGVLCDGYDLVLGSGSFIGAYENADAPEKNNRGFEEQLVGMKVGETRTITVTFPDNYGSDELNGTVIKFDVTVNSIRKGTLPELTDEIIADYTGDAYTTVETAKEAFLAYYKGTIAYSLLFEAFAVRGYPDGPIDSAITDYVTDYVDYTYEEKLTDEELQTVFEEQYDNALAYAEEAVGERMVLEYLFKYYDVTMTQGEYREALEADLEQNYYEYYLYYGITDADSLEKTFGKDLLVTQYKYEKLLPVLAEKVVFE